MDGPTPSNSLNRIARCLALMTWLLGTVALAQSHGNVSVSDCPSTLETEFHALLDLELAPQVRAGVDIVLVCAANRGSVTVRKEEHTLVRSVGIDEKDAARWLSLAAAELTRQAEEQAAQRKSDSAKQPVQRHPVGVRLLARARLGDEPITLRTGAEAGLDYLAQRRAWLAMTLRFTTALRDVEGDVRVRASDASALLAVGYALETDTLRLMPGLGFAGGVTQLRAQSTGDDLTANTVTRGFAGPALVLRAQLIVVPRLAIELALEGSYTLPRVEGRTETRNVLFAQTSWSSALSLGLHLSL